MAGDDPEKSAIAALELGIYYADQPGGAEEAESCLRHAIAVGHPAVTPQALLNLAGLLHSVYRTDEAVQIYRTLIDLKDPGTLTPAIYALGFVLSGQPEHMKEGESFLRQAAASDDPDYGPLASYDLGVLLANQPGRLSEALDALLQAAASNHPEHAPRAYFNLGVLLAGNGAPKEAEGAFHRVIAGNDPELAPMAAVNLGGLLENYPGRVADAEAAYQFAIDSHHPEQMPLAMFNLGNLLAKLPERQADSEKAYRGAMSSPNPQVAAGAAYNLGVLLLTDRSRRVDAETAFRAAADTGDPEHAPIAMYNLGRLLGEDVNRWADARQALEDAVNTGDPRVTGPANNLLLQLDVSQLPERLIPTLDDSWRCTRAISQGAFYIEEYFTGSETADNWTALVTATQNVVPNITPQAYMDAIRQDFENNVIDGELSWQILEQTETELIYESEISGDVANPDQNEVSRIVYRNDRFYTVQHAIRGDLARAGSEKPQRLAMLRAARFERAPSPSPVTAPAVDENVADAILEKASSTMSNTDRIAFYRDSLKQLSKESYPLHWGSLQFQLGLALLEQNPETPANDDDLDEAAASLRRALEIFRPKGHPDLWGRSLASLGRVEFARAKRHGKSDEPVKKELVEKSLSHAIAAFEKALTAFKPGSYDWSRLMLNLGDARFRVDIDAAAATYTEMLSVAENMPPLSEEERALDLHMELAYLTGSAMASLRSIDQSKGGEPIVPAGILEADRRGELLYLRPLLSAGRLLLPNRSVAGAFKIGYPTEPENITLESLLYRVLAVEMSFMSLGGRPEGYGATRFIMATGGTEWQSTLKILEKTAELILMVPHLSDGVRWELKLLSERGSLSKTLFIMPPLATDVDVPKLWAEATPMMNEYGLEIPPYRPDGRILRFAPDGKVAEQWDFELLWKNDLLPAIEHLLPKRE